MSQLPPLTATDLSARLAKGEPVRLVDVREPHEFTSELGHIAGSELIPLGTLPTALAKLQGEAREIVVVCRSGMRAQKATDLLVASGLTARVLTGGMLAWNDAKLPIQR